MRVSLYGIDDQLRTVERGAVSLEQARDLVLSGRLQMRSWETQEGDKRTVVEIEADELGPSLRWATAKVERQGRSGGSSDWTPATVGAPMADEETPLDAT